MKQIIGVGVIVIKDNKLLLGLQNRKYEDICWASPGGKNEEGESLEETAIREVKEETSITVANPQLIYSFEDEVNGDKIISKIFKAEYVEGLAQIMEPEKCFEWKWFDINELPDNLTMNLKKLTEINYFKFQI